MNLAAITISNLSNSQRFETHFISFSTLNTLFKPVKRSRAEESLFYGVYIYDIPKEIQKFHEIQEFSTETKFKLTGLCRAILVLLVKFPKLIDLMDFDAIPQFAFDLHADIYYFYRSKFKKDLIFYTDCITRAIQIFMDKLGFTCVSKINEKNVESLGQEILYAFLKFYEQQQKLEPKENFFYTIDKDDKYLDNQVFHEKY